MAECSNVPGAEVDLSRLEDITGGDEETIAMLIGLFIDDSSNCIAQLEAALVQNDTGELRRHAHSLKGAAANMGANSLSEQAKALEDLAKENLFATARIQLDLIRATHDQVLAELRDHQTRRT